MRTGGLSGGVVDASGECKELLDGYLLRLGLVMLLDATLKEVVLLNLLVEHDRDFVYLNTELENEKKK